MSVVDERERRLRLWFSAWLTQDAGAVDEVFAQDIVYSECYGPEYRGIHQVRRWFEEWNQRGRVLDWTIREMYRDGDMLIAVWTFCCMYDGVTDGFDGVTLARFDEAERLVSLREFQSKAEHELSYGRSDG